MVDPSIPRSTSKLPAYHGVLSVAVFAVALAIRFVLAGTIILPVTDGFAITDTVSRRPTRTGGRSCLRRTEATIAGRNSDVVGISVGPTKIASSLFFLSTASSRFPVACGGQYSGGKMFRQGSLLSGSVAASRNHEMETISNDKKDGNSDNANDSDNDGSFLEDDPDLVGAHVDGFPLPPTPVRSDDAKILERLRRVPVTPLTDRNFLKDTSISQQGHRPLRVLIAGGGLGGLALASALLRSSDVPCDVHVLERASRYRPFGGPIQLQSNALAALRDIAPEVYEAVEQCGVRTGDRLSGIKDGVRYGEGWLVKFDASTPAVKKGLPLTLAINRVALQSIFLKYGIPPERVHTRSRVVSYEVLPGDDDGGGGRGVAVQLQNGTVVYGDVLVGADGIWSTVRHQMLGLPLSETGVRYAGKHARYSGYTCYTGTCRHTPADIADVAYKVFLGQRQYLGCTDAGSGWQHWWAFLPDPPGGALTSTETGIDMLNRLCYEFCNWSPEILDLFHATKPEVVRRRDLYDRLPMFNDGWTDRTGRVVLLGDACHPTMPNLGQGGAMAVEDAAVLSQELLKGRGGGAGEVLRDTDDIPTRLRRYERRRFFRASVAQFLSRNGSDLLVDWDKLRNTPLIGPLAMWMINSIQPLTMDYLYSADF